MHLRPPACAAPGPAAGSRRLPLVCLLLAVLRCAWADDAQAANWPQFRGPDGDGHASGSAPLAWSEQEGVLWKTPIHDRGWSSPVVWGKQVWLTTATATGSALSALCLDRDDGSVLHDLKVFEVERPEKINTANTYASPTPLIEEGRLFVHFGTYGTACIDTTSGALRWSRRDIHCDHEMGPGSSLASVGDLVVFDMDGIDQQYVIALDKASGATRWRTPRSLDYSAHRKDTRKAFNTPTLVAADGASQLICPAADAVFGYEALTGRELWRVRYKGWSNTIRTVTGHGLAFIGADFVQPQLWAVRLGGSGDVTASHVAWTLKKNMPATPSPLLVDDLLYVVSDGGVATCIEAASGTVVWERKLGGVFGASPVHADGRLYFFARKGTTTVMAAGRGAQVLRVNQLDGESPVMASPAVVQGRIYLRSQTHLYCLGSPGLGSPAK